MNNSRNINLTYDKALRFVAFFMAIWLWSKSVGFSSDGFGVDVTSPEARSTGIGFALAFTVIQLVWNRMRGDMSNLTIFVFGIVAYGYSLTTDFVGFGNWIGMAGNVASVKGVITVIVSAMMEILPEPFVLWAITGSFTGGDFLSNIFAPQKGVADNPQYGNSTNKSKGFNNAYKNLPKANTNSQYPRPASTYKPNNPVKSSSFVNRKSEDPLKLFMRQDNNSIVEDDDDSYVN